MKTVKILRLWNDGNQTTGTLIVYNDKGQPIFGSLCIERGDRNNQKNISRVPSGKYRLVYEWSPRFKQNLWELKGVPNRSECKIHPSNFWDQLNGCIAPGVKLKDLDKDGYYDVTQSKPTTAAFQMALKGMNETTIEIIDVSK
jgi:hypothetical protein